MQRSIASLLGPLCLSVACVPPPEGSGGAKGHDDHEASGAEVAKGEGGDCQAYADALCEVAGKESSTCRSVESVTKILSASACAAGLADIDESKEKIAALGDVCRELEKRLCGDVGPDSKSCEMVKAQVPGMPPEQCEQMTERYDEVLASLREMEERNKPLAPDMVEKMLAGDPPSFGPGDAAVTVIEFSDFQCPYCSQAAEAVHEIEKKYDGKARVIFRQFPLTQIHPDAHLAAQASLAAHAQGKFVEYHDKLFANQRALSRDDLDKYADEIGLDMGKFKKALDDGTFKQQVDDEMELGRSAYVGGTPTMFVGAERVENPTDPAAISAIIDKQLAG